MIESSEIQNTTKDVYSKLQRYLVPVLHQFFYIVQDLHLCYIDFFLYELKEMN